MTYRSLATIGKMSFVVTVNTCVLYTLLPLPSHHATFPTIKMYSEVFQQGFVGLTALYDTRLYSRVPHIQDETAAKPSLEGIWYQWPPSPPPFFSTSYPFRAHFSSNYTTVPTSNMTQYFTYG